MKLKLYNTLTRKVDEFKPVQPGKAGIYSCGPTVYWNQHIGHMYAYVQWDVLVRLLRFLDYQVQWVMNITDVGHLTSDEDAGEDKMEVGAKREGVSVWEIADKYIDQFVESLDLLNIQRPDVLARATEHIEEQINLIKKIEGSGFTYQTKMGIVLDTSKFPDYAKFGRLKLEKQRVGDRQEVDPEKKAPWDFYLWVTGRPEHVMQWESPWGRGFPGWHLECTAMSTKYLGEQFDIHTGGQEHILVHHTNEIAQAYAAFGQQTANYWLHNGWLTLKGEKMSKSLGNVVTAQGVVEKDYNPLVLRYLILTSHYRKGLVFDWKALDAAGTAYEKLVQLIRDGQEEGKRGEKKNPARGKQLREEFVGKLSDDLNIPEGLAVLWEAVKDKELSDSEKKDLVLEFDRVLGLGLAEVKPIKISPQIKKLAAKREKLRKQEKWQEADKIRVQIEKEGFRIEDTELGAKIVAVG